LPGRTEEHNEDLSQSIDLPDRESNSAPTEYEARVSTPQLRRPV